MIDLELAIKGMLSANNTMALAIDAMIFWLKIQLVALALAVAWSGIDSLIH